MFNASSSPITHHYRPRNKNTYITLDQNGEVCVRTPIKSEFAVRNLLKSKENWIREKLGALSESREQSHSLGKTLRFRGENYQVSQFPKLHKKLEKVQKTLNIEKYYHQFYREEAILTLPSRIEHYARKMQMSPSDVRFKKMRRRWGSCDSRGVVTFNILMMQLSYEHIDYIIVHELAHLRHMNHSKDFHDLVRCYLRDEKRLRRELRGIRPV